MSYSPLNSEGIAIYPAAQAKATDRAEYLGKVYGLCFAGIAVFFATALLPLIGKMTDIPALAGAFDAIMSIPPLVSFLIILGSSFVAPMFFMMRGVNVVVFFLMSALWGAITLPLMAYAIVATGGPGVIFQAAGITSIVFGGLTGYVLITKKDFGFLGGMLFAGMMVLLGGIVVGIVGQLMGYPMSILSLAISMFAVLLFSGYVLYDTSEILHRYSTDMVVPAAFSLMLDFIILFRNILMLLSRRD